MALCAYQPQIYHDLGDVEKVAEMVTENQIREVGKIILEHGYGNQVMVVLAHRHHALSPHEVMLEQNENGIKVSRPVNRDYLDDLGNVTPNLIVYKGNDEWYPVGYGIDNMTSAWKDSTFLKKIGTYLMNNNLQDTLMLAARNQDDRKIEGGCFVEYNFREPRRSEIHFVSDKDLQQGIKTTYGFGAGPTGEVEQYCFYQCINIKGHYKEHTKC